MARLIRVCPHCASPVAFCICRPDLSHIESVVEDRHSRRIVPPNYRECDEAHDPELTERFYKTICDATLRDNGWLWVDVLDERGTAWLRKND